MPNLIETAEQQLTRDTVLHAASSNPANNKDEKIALTHNLGVSREPDDAHRELNSLGFTVTRASTTTHQNVAKPGSTRQLAPKGNQTWKYNHPNGFKAEMNMRDSGNTSVTMNAPRATHERFRTRMDMKPHPAFKKMDADSANEKDSKKKGKVSAGADFDVRKMKDPLYAASSVEAGGPGSGRHATELNKAGFKKDSGISRRSGISTQENHFQHPDGPYYKVTRNVDEKGKQTDVKSWRYQGHTDKAKGDNEASLISHVQKKGKQGISKWRAASARKEVL